MENEEEDLLFTTMDGYTDKLSSPLSQFSPSSTAAAIVHGTTPLPINSLNKEGDRRVKMAESYNLLLSMLPNHKT